MKIKNLIAVAALLMGNISAFAADETSSTSLFEFSYNSNGATITRFVSDPKDAEVKELVIPAEVKHASKNESYKVIAIADNAFDATKDGQAKAADIETVTFASSNLVKIGKEAFKACAKLKSANFASATGLKEIGVGAFKGTALVELDLSKTRVGDVVPTATNKILRLFTGTSTIDYPSHAALTTVKLSAYWKSIDASAFEGCTALKNFDFNTQNSEWLIANTASQTIGDNAFKGTAIETLDLTTTTITTLPALFGTVYNGTYSVNNNKLQTVKFPATCTAIATSAFENCTALASVSMGAIATLGNRAFLGTALTTLDLSSSTLTTIDADAIVNNGTTAFAGAPKSNSKLETVKLPQAFATLTNAFANCSALSSINLNNTVITALPVGAFVNDAALTSITLSNRTPAAIALAANAFESTGLTSVSIPAGITVIPASAFENCADLVTVAFGHSATTAQLSLIDANAFYNCKKIETITLPASTPATAEVVAAEAFSGCTGLKTFTYVPTATTIGAAVVNPNAFKNCNSKKSITFKTSEKYAQANAIPTTIKTYKYEYSAATGTSLGTMWSLTEYAKESGKYYVKLNVPATKPIKIKADDNTAVYDAYEDNGKLYMCKFKTKGGYYQIGDGAHAWPCIVITTNKDLTYDDLTTAVSYSQNQMADPTADWYNIVKYQAAKQRFSDVQTAYPGKNLYGWVNSSTSGTGWKKITSGDYFNEGVMFCPVTPAAGGRLEVVWLDEDGNVENVEGELTAIQKIENNVEERGALYNLAGQKVNANYKGVVIKNGKKYIK